MTVRLVRAASGEAAPIVLLGRELQDLDRVLLKDWGHIAEDKIGGEPEICGVCSSVSSAFASHGSRGSEVPTGKSGP